MIGETITIDIEKLREDLENDALGAFFGGGFGGAFVTASDIRNASAKELIEIAKQMGVDLDDYR